VARVFISHSSRDEPQAGRLLEWLRAQGFTETFLDFDKHAGIAPGSDWERTLYREIARAEAVILILTANWFESKWCFAEFAQARALGKAIFPIVETPTGETFVAPDIQSLDLIKDRDGGLQRLGSELSRIALNARGGFPWDASRPVFPGLLAFDEPDAAIYFGRDDDIRRVIERLNARRAQGGAKLVALLGASGAGKSSLLRAGVLPRLKRDRRNWIALPPFRPQLHPLDELAQAVALALGQSGDWRQWREAFAADNPEHALSDLARDLRALQGANEAQILISIDQAEELFATADKVEAARFFAVLGASLNERLPFIVLMALRSDYLGLLQQAPGLAAEFDEVSLKPMPLERVREIIEGPARVAGIAIEDALTAATMKDAATDDALPLLAFALRELYDRFAETGHLTLEAYRALGDQQAGLSPLENAVRRKADEVLSEAKPAPEDLQALKEAFVPALVRVNAEGEYVRRPARLESLPEKAKPLIGRLTKARLLILRQEGSSPVVEVAHEALLRKWPLLRGWLDEEREFLIGKDQLESDLKDWDAAPEGQKTEALLSGLKLTRAQGWLVGRPQQLTTAERALIQASLNHHAAEVARRERFRRGVLIGSVAAALVLAVVAAGAVWEWRTARVQEERARAERDRAEKALAAATQTANALAYGMAQKFRNRGLPIDLVRDILNRALALQRQLSDSGETSPDLRRSEAGALMESVDTFLAQGDTKAALAAAERSRAILESLVASNHDDASSQRALSASQNKNGDVLLATGRREEALEVYQKGLAILQALAATQPENDKPEGDMSVSYNKIGDILVTMGQREAALDAYRSSLAIRERLVVAAPRDTHWQLELSLGYVRIGDLLVLEGKREEALDTFRKSEAIQEKLVSLDPRNTDWRGELAVSDDKIGDVLVAAGRQDEALEAYRKSLAIRDILAAADTGNATWQLGLSVSDNKVGDLLLAAGKREEALEVYRKGLAIREKLGTADAGNSGWQLELSISYERVGNVLFGVRQRDAALDAYRKSLAIRQKLAASDPHNTRWQRNLALGYSRVGDVLRANGQSEEALDSYRKGLAIRENLVAIDPSNVGWQRDLSIEKERTADMLLNDNQREEALRLYRESLDIREKLAATDPENAQWQSDVAECLFKLARAGDDARAHLTRALEIMHQLDVQKKLTADQVGRIRMIEREFAKLPN
jgi:tetratricopeptide (TPR) repeat protein